MRDQIDVLCFADTASASEETSPFARVPQSQSPDRHAIDRLNAVVDD